MERRQALKNVAALLSTALTATTLTAILEGCRQPPGTVGGLFTPEHESLIHALCDLIIPKTNTPGATDAQVGPFITMMLEECYPIPVQTMFIDGLNDVNTRARNQYDASFDQLELSHRLAILTQVREVTLTMRAQDGAKPYFFSILHELTVLGFRTSEVGATQAFAYVDIPGRYEGCINIAPGQQAWA